MSRFSLATYCISNHPKKATNVTLYTAAEETDITSISRMRMHHVHVRGTSPSAAACLPPHQFLLPESTTRDARPATPRGLRGVHEEPPLWPRPLRARVLRHHQPGYLWLPQRGRVVDPAGRPWRRGKAEVPRPHAFHRAEEGATDEPGLGPKGLVWHQCCLDRPEGWCKVSYIPSRAKIQVYAASHSFLDR